MFLKRLSFLAFLLPACMLFVPACNDDEETELIGNWVSLSDFEGVSRCDAVGFSIGNKGYVGTGYDGSDYLKDFWEYDAERDTWMQKAEFPGQARLGAVGFGTDTMGYIGTGYDGVNKKKDFWEYNPRTNTWTQKADFGGSARYGAIGVAINNKGYIGTGYDGNYLKDFWEYNPATDTWTQKVSVGGSKRKDAIAFVILGKAYVGTGNNNGVPTTDFLEYDPLTDSWDEKAEITDATKESFDNKYTSITGSSKVAFAVNDKGYVATGGIYAGAVLWEYDPSTDRWKQKTSFEGSERLDATGFAIGDRGYICTGRNSSSYYDDIWGLDPDADYDKYD